MKIREKIKKVSILCLIFLLSINSFATSISNNDGSAFITKAEFDALKSSFQSQIDTYNQGIDSKIDSAIASYLAGIKVSKSETRSLIFSTWDGISCFNGAYKPTYVKPTVDACYDLLYAWNRAWETAANPNHRNGAWSIQLSVKNKKNASDHAERPLVTGNTETNQTVGAVWNGIALSYDENYTLAKTATVLDQTWLMWIDGPVDHDYGGTLIDALKFNPSGTYSDTDSIVAKWTPTLYWKYKDKTSSSWLTQTITPPDSYTIGKICSLSVVLSFVGDKAKKYEHIIQYDGGTAWRVSNETFTKTLRQPADSSIYSKNILSSATNKSKNWFWGQLTKGGNISESYSGKRINLAATGGTMDIGVAAVDGSIEDTTTTIWPVIGMLNSDLEAKKINQISDVVSITGFKEPVTLEPQTLEKGFPLFYVEEETSIEWKPVFDKYLKWNGTGYAEQNDKITLALSYGPFSDKMTTSKPVQFKTDSETTLAGKHTVELAGSKITFEPQEDGIIYAKWVPDTTSYTSDTWISNLSLKNCNSYTITKENS